MYIYQIKNIVNGRIYIGSTKNFKSRKSKHFADLSKGKHHSFLLQRAYNKYGREYFEFSIIEEVSDLDRAIREQYYLDKFQPFYNVLKVVNTFSKPTKEGLEKMRKARIRPVLQYSLDGILIKKWGSIVEASKELNIHEGSISWMCRGRYKQVGGFIFKYQDEDFEYSPAYARIPPEIRSLRHAEGASKTYLVEKPNGEITEVKNLLKFCKENNLSYNAVCTSISRNRRYRGLKITKIKDREKGE